MQNQIFQTHLKVSMMCQIAFFWIRKSSNCEFFYSIIFSVYVSRRYYIKDIKCVFAIFLMHTLMKFVQKPISIMFRIKFTFYYLVVTTKLCLNYEKRSRNYEKLISYLRENYLVFRSFLVITRNFSRNYEKIIEDIKKI